jgi:hypothetical protein
MKAAFSNSKSTFKKQPLGDMTYGAQYITNTTDVTIHRLGMSPAYVWPSCLTFPEQEFSGRNS